MILPLLLLCLAGPADLDYERGMALARAGQWAEADAAFREGERRAPRDKRFPIERAGVAFKRHDFSGARRHLRRALHLAPRDAYANDFAGTLALLDGNTEAALTYWNRIGKPRLERIRMEPEPRIDPVLLDRAFAFAPSSTLQLSEYRTTRAQLDLLDAFSTWTLTLDPQPAGDRFDAVLRTTQAKTWLTALRGLAFQTVYPELLRPGGRALRVRTMLRWDAQKRRASIEVSGPLGRMPAWHYRLTADGRNENWVVPGEGGFNLKRTEAGAEIATVLSDRWQWRAGAAATHRQFTNVSFAEGTTLETHTGFTAALLRIPERRFTIISGADARAGRFFGRGLFTKTQGSAEAHWFPRARGDDYETSLRVRAGTATGSTPFDELYMLGLERDNDLWLRAHIGTADGKKGSSPIGRTFALENWEIDKTVREGSIYTLRVGPFLDIGRVWGGPGTRFGYSGWMYDTGAQAKLRLLGMAEVVFTWGKDLHTGSNAWYVTLR